jgi:ankyrin repeat protein
VNLIEFEILFHIFFNQKALNGHENALRALMNHPAARPKRPDPLDNFNRTPLHLAAWFGQKHTTEALLRNAANVNAKDVQVFHCQLFLLCLCYFIIRFS